MNRTIHLSILLLSFASVSAAGFLPPHPFTDDARGTTAASFLKSPASARLAALGFGAAALKGPDAFFYNPAGAASLQAGEQAGLLGYESLLEGAGRGAGAWLKGAPGGVLGLGAVYRYDAGMEKYDIYGDAAGRFDAYDAAFSVLYGARFGRLDAGASVKYIRSKLDDRTAGSAALDLGAIFGSGAGGVDFAVFIRNLGPAMKLGSERAALPSELGASLGWHYLPRFGLFLDARGPSDHSPYFLASGEYSIPFRGGSSGGAASDSLFLRAGLNFKNNSDLGMLGVFSAGFGARLRGTGFDYAFVPYGDLGSTHRFTLSRRFGGSGGPARTAERVQPAGNMALLVATFSAGEGVDENLARQFSDLLEAELKKTGKFRVLPRTEPDLIHIERSPLFASLDEKEKAAGLSDRLGAEAVLSGSVSAAAGGFMISASLRDASGGQLYAGVREAEGRHLFRQAARELAAEFSRRY